MHTKGGSFLVSDRGNPPHVEMAKMYQGPPANLTQGAAQLSMTSQFYRQVALTAEPDPPGAGLVKITHVIAVTAGKRKGHKRAAFLARRPLMMSFLLSPPDCA